MSKTQRSLVLLATFLGGIIGGVLSERMFLPTSAMVQKSNGVNAEEFLLLDQSGKARAGLGLDQNGEVGLVLTSRDGGKKLALSPDGPTAIKLTDRSGRVLWAAP